MQHSAFADPPVLSRGDVLRRISDPNGDGEQLLLGQNVGHSNFQLRSGYQRFFLQLERKTGFVPPIMSIDLGYNTVGSSQEVVRQLAGQHATNGGIVSLSMSPRNPWRGTSLDDTLIIDPDEIFREGSAAFIRWRAVLDRVGDQLEQLQDDGVIVLWRPFHEMNGGWFWWGGSQKETHLGRNEFVRLWRDMHHEFTQTRGLTNLLWVYSPSTQYYPDGEKPVLYYYPGDDVVDVVGLDFYGDDVAGLDANNSYSELTRIPKPFGLCEFGPLEKQDGSFNLNRAIEALHKKYPKTRFAILWHSWDNKKMAIVDVEFSPHQK